MIQTMIDKCADGTWQGQILVGSVPFGSRSSSYFNGATFTDVAVDMGVVIAEIERAERDEA